VEGGVWLKTSSGRRSWMKTSYGGRGLAENVGIPSYGGRGSKMAKKNVI